MPSGGSFGRNGNRRSRWGLALAIAVSVIGHPVFFYVAFFILPGFLTQPKAPASYTVKIVDQLPAGDLGTHLPRLAGRQKKTRGGETRAPESAAAGTPNRRRRKCGRAERDESDRHTYSHAHPDTHSNADA